MAKNSKSSAPAAAPRAKPRVLFAMGEREINATSMRLMRYPKLIAALGYQVDVITHDVPIKEQLDQYYGNVEGVTTLLLQQEDRFWTMRQRDGFAQTFIKLYQDIPLPGTDIPFWKLVAFDDFLWHVTRTVQAPLQGEYQAVFMPVPSTLERPRESADLFYTNMVYYCKHQGVAPERVFTVDGRKDGYCISTVDDPFLTMVVQDQLKVNKDAFAIAIVNHSSNRMQIKEIIETLGSLKQKKAIFFVFVGIAVRELTERSLFDELLKPVLEQHAQEFYTVENGGVMRALMLSDVIISTSYILLSFAPKYGKTSVVYNPLRDAT